MLGKNMLVSLVFQVRNKGMGGFRTINNEFKKLDETVKATSRRFEHLTNMGRRLTMAGAGMTVAGGGLAYSLGLTDAVSQSLQAEHNLRALGNTGELTARQILEIDKSLQQTSRDTNQFVKELLPGLQTLVASGLRPDFAARFMPTIGKTATASGGEATVTDLAKTAFAMYNNLKVLEGELPWVMNIITQAAKEGNFELADMARNFSSITAQAGALKLKGPGAVAQIGAALQVAKIGAGNADEAANNFQNFLAKITAKETVANFKKFGVDVKAELDAALAAGADPIEHFMRVIMSVTGGSIFKLNEIFGDLQVRAFLIPMMDNFAEYLRIRDKTFQTRGVVDKDFQNMMTTTQNQLKALRINMALLAMPTLNAFFSRLNGLLTDLNGNSLALKLALGGVVGLLVGGATLTGLGLAAQGFVAINAAMAALGITSAWALWWLVPFAAAAYLFYKNWDKVVTSFKMWWEILKGIAQILANITGARKLAGWFNGEEPTPFDASIGGAVRNIKNAVHTANATINYAPTINMPDASPEALAKATTILRSSKDEFARMWQGVQADQERIAY